jgi:urea transport system substrate-binding protein
MGKIKEDGSINIVWSADYPIRPVPYPSSRSVMDWDSFLENLYVSWDHSWVNRSPNPTKPGQP